MFPHPASMQQKSQRHYGKPMAVADELKPLLYIIRIQHAQQQGHKNKGNGSHVRILAQVLPETRKVGFGQAQNKQANFGYAVQAFGKRQRNKKQQPETNR